MFYIPILGEFREIIIIMETVLIFFSWQFGIFFIFKFFQNKQNRKLARINIVWSTIFFAFGFTFLNYQFSDFYFVYRPLFLFFGYISMAIAIAIFSFYLEKIGTYNSKKILPLFSLLMVILLIVTFFIDPTLPTFLANISVFPLIAILLFYIFQLFRNLEGKFRFYSIGLFGGMSLLALGNIGAGDVTVQLFGIGIRVLADFLMIFGSILVAIFFNILPSLSEIEWYDKLNYILVIEHSGICLYNENYKNRQPINERILAASLLNIQNFLDSLTGDYKKVKTLVKENEYFLIEYGKRITAILIATEPLESLKILLKQFVIQFEDFFSDTLKDWKGKIKLFSPTSQLISNIFKKVH